MSNPIINVVDPHVEIDTETLAQSRQGLRINGFSQLNDLFSFYLQNPKKGRKATLIFSDAHLRFNATYIVQPHLTLYAVSPSGSTRPWMRQQAVTVLARRQAIVIGPTPPGTGVIAPATSAQDA